MKRQQLSAPGALPLADLRRDRANPLARVTPVP